MQRIKAYSEKTKVSEFPPRVNLGSTLAARSVKLVTSLLRVAVEHLYGVKRTLLEASVDEG